MNVIKPHDKTLQSLSNTVKWRHKMLLRAKEYNCRLHLWEQLSNYTISLKMTQNCIGALLQEALVTIPLSYLHIFKPKSRITHFLGVFSIPADQEEETTSKLLSIISSIKGGYAAGTDDLSPNLWLANPSCWEEVLAVVSGAVIKSGKLSASWLICTIITIFFFFLKLQK